MSVDTAGSLLDYCTETRQALAVSLGVSPLHIDHNIDILTGKDGTSQQGLWYTVDAPGVPLRELRLERSGWCAVVHDGRKRRKHQLKATPGRWPWEAATEAALLCGRKIRCGRCREPVVNFGGIWFSRLGARCTRSFDTAHDPQSWGGVSLRGG